MARSHRCATVPRESGQEAVVVGTDGSASARLAIRCAARVAAANDAIVHLVAVYAGGSGRCEDADRVLAGAEQELRELGVRTRLHAVPGKPSRALCRIAEREGASLIVVGNRGSGSVLGWLQRPLCQRVARRAKSRVLVVDTRAQWGAFDESARIALAHAEPMAVRVDRAVDGPRLYVAGLRVHHGLTGQLLALDGVRRRGRLGAVELIVGGVLVRDDWRDFPFPMREW